MAVLNGIKHIFFDLDDTLWDFKANSERVLRELYSEFALGEKLRVRPEEFLEAYNRINRRYWWLYGRGETDKESLRKNRFPETLSSFGYSDETLGSRLTSVYLERAPKGERLTEGCLETLAWLKTRYSLHILTNGFADVQHIKIEASGIRPYVEQVLVSEIHQLRKPDPRFFRLAESLSGATAPECLMVGDQIENDVNGALQAGWQAIHFDREASAAHDGWRIASLPELREWL